MLLFLTLAVCILNTEALIQQDCRSSGECNDDECCTHKISITGKRKLVGHCSPRAAENEKCVMFTQYVDSLIYGTCPCADGYICDSRGVMDIRGVCRKAVNGGQTS
ncbi:hypothetical protein SNE40_006954 [Patella caerulea]|uniref:Uncharacterized protein n=1 Tax=Patella caerulea TaxID=87958 RepID=A0AAN8JSX3_PATCE